MVYKSSPNTDDFNKQLIYTIFIYTNLSNLLKNETNLLCIL